MWHWASLLFQMRDRSGKVGRIPDHNGAGDEVQRAGPMALRLNAVIVQASCAMKEYRVCRDVSSCL